MMAITYPYDDEYMEYDECSIGHYFFLDDITKRCYNE